MVAMMVLSAVLTAQDPSHRHVRSTEPLIRTLIEEGLAHSETFRKLVETLDESDVVVYVEQKITRESLGGYLAHDILNAGGVRYLHIALNLRGGDIRLISLLAHELQHAAEVAADPGAREVEGLRRLFTKLAGTTNCDSSSCFETKQAQDVEERVSAELKAAR